MKEHRSVRPPKIHYNLQSEFKFQVRVLYVLNLILTLKTLQHFVHFYCIFAIKHLSVTMHVLVRMLLWTVNKDLL